MNKKKFRAYEQRARALEIREKLVRVEVAEAEAARQAQQDAWLSRQRDWCTEKQVWDKHARFLLKRSKTVDEPPERAATSPASPALVATPASSPVAEPQAADEAAERPSQTVEPVVEQQAAMESWATVEATEPQAAGTEPQAASEPQLVVEAAEPRAVGSAVETQATAEPEDTNSATEPQQADTEPQALEQFAVQPEADSAMEAQVDPQTAVDAVEPQAQDSAVEQEPPSAMESQAVASAVEPPAGVEPEGMWHGVGSGWYGANRRGGNRRVLDVAPGRGLRHKAVDGSPRGSF